MLRWTQHTNHLSASLPKRAGFATISTVFMGVTPVSRPNGIDKAIFTEIDDVISPRSSSRLRVLIERAIGVSSKTCLLPYCWPGSAAATRYGCLRPQRRTQ